MKKLNYHLLLSLLFLCETVMAQGFRNPVLPGFHADPSVCRAGDDFYSTRPFSTFLVCRFSTARILCTGNR